MRIGLKAAVIILILLIGLVSLIAIVVLTTLWIGGGKIVFIPGLEIVIATPVLITFFATVEIFMLGLAFFVWRTKG